MYRLTNFLAVLGITVAICNGLEAQEYRVLPATPQPAPVQIALDVPQGMTFTAPLAVTRSSEGMIWYGGGPNMELVDFLASQHNQNQIEFSTEQKALLKDFQKRLSKEYSSISSKFPELKDKNLSRDDRRKINASRWIRET